MTNIAIISNNMELLIHDNIITSDNVIHTYAGWQERGYQVKKGEKAIAKFPIWKYTKGKKEMTEEDAQAKGYCFMKNSAWFSDLQVEPIKEK